MYIITLEIEEVIANTCGGPVSRERGINMYKDATKWLSCYSLTAVGLLCAIISRIRLNHIVGTINTIIKLTII